MNEPMFRAQEITSKQWEVFGLTGNGDATLVGIFDEEDLNESDYANAPRFPLPKPEA